MTGSGISVDGYNVTVCGGRDVAGSSTGGMSITFESGVTYSDLSDQPAAFDGSGCFSYYGYLDATPIVAVSVDGLGSWSGSNWWVDDPPLPPQSPEPEPVAPPSDPAPVADSPGPAPADVTTNAPLTKVADSVTMPDFTATPFPTPTATPTTGSTFTLVPTSTPTPEPVTGDAFALDPLTATVGALALGAAGGAAYLAIKTGARR